MLTQSAGPDWIPAQINYPLTTGDQLWTDFDGRAEFHIGSAAIRLHQETSATFTLLDDQTVQLQLIAGGLNLRVRNLYPDEIFEVDTPNAAFTIRQPGDYRIDVAGEQTKIIVWSGAAEVSGDNRNFPLRARDYAVVSGYGQLSYSLMNAPGPDEFDRWAQDRDRRQQQQAQSARYVPADMIGSEDLELYGSWSEVPDLGPVWSPRVDPGWAPYKTGHWAWIEPWGWTWIDDSPWGFAPFHYGRWAFVTGSWGWIPGPRNNRAVYSPALVAWAGSGRGMAWFALGPGEVYVPSHRASAAYVTRVNVSNTVVNRTVITNVYNTTIINKTVNNTTYVNQGAPGAVVAMSHADMAAGRRSAVNVAPQTLQASPVAPIPATRPMLQPVQRIGSSAPAPRPPAAVATPSRPAVMRNRPDAAAVQRPVFTPATGVPAPQPAQTPSSVAPRPSTQPPAQQPVPAPPADPSRRTFPARDSETVRPTPPPPAQADRPGNSERFQRPSGTGNPPPVTAPPARPAERIERPVTPPVERVERPEPRLERPTPPPAERVERPQPRLERPVPPPAERVERPQPRLERPIQPPAERVERPQPRPEHVERPINPPAAAPVVHPEARPEPRREEPKPEKKEEKKEDKKKEDKKP